MKMKTTYAIVTSTLLTISVTGCNRDAADKLSDPAPRATDDSVQVVQSSKARDMDPQVSSSAMSAVTSGNATFAFDLLQKLSSGTEGQTKNLVFSPYSLSSAFSMVYAGARGNTATEMKGVFHFPDAGGDFYAAYNKLDLSLNTTTAVTGSAPFTMRIANAAWGQEGYGFQPSYLDILAHNYGAGLNTLDMNAGPAVEPSRKTINDWVSLKTDGKIANLLPVNSITDAKLVLTNAIYFFANWKDRFDTSLTADGMFSLANGASVTIPMMNRGYVESQYVKTSNFEAIELPYVGGRVVMQIVLPGSGQMDVALPAIAANNYDAMIGSGTKYVNLVMPKFSINTERPLKELLKSMGMNDAFVPGVADFTGINLSDSQKLHLFNAYHKAVITVDENGTEAAASTGAVAGPTGGTFVDMTVNRPFLFMIKDKQTGTLLFLGRVMNPNVL